MALTVPTPTTTKTANVLPYTQPGQLVQPVAASFQPGAGLTAPQAPQIQPGTLAAPTYTPDQMNAAVLQAGQQKAIQGFQSPVADMTSQLTQQVLQNPAFGLQTPEQYGKTQLEQYDVERANALEAARQTLAPTMNTGASRGKYVDLALQGVQERTQLERDLFNEAQQQQREAMFQALSEGRATGEQEQQRFATDIGALAQISGAAEGEATRQFTASENAMNRALEIAKTNQNAELQTSLTELQGKIQQGLLMTEQDFAGVQNELDRQQQLALQNNDIAAAYEIETLKQQFAADMQEKQMEYQTAERVATQAWQTGERIGEQEFSQAMAYFDRETQIARDAQNFMYEKQLADDRAALELKMQTQGFTQQEKMTYLENELADARANNDVTRQMQIMTYGHSLDLETMAQEQGFEFAMADMQNQFAMALQNNEQDNAMSILSAQQRFAAQEAAKDRDLDWARVEMEKRGLDMAQIEQQYNLIQNEVDAGRVDPDSATNYLRSILSANGVTLQTADPNAIYQELDRDFRVQQYQFALTHPGSGIYQNDRGDQVPEGTPGAIFTGLSTQFVNEFNDFLNDSYYDESGKILTTGDINELKGGDAEDAANHSAYLDALNNAPAISVSITSTRKNELGGVPEQGTLVNVNGRLMQITRSKYEDTSGRDDDRFEIMDIGTGAKQTFSGMSGHSGGVPSVNELSNWADGLGNI
jgi:hypothetical protein